MTEQINPNSTNNEPIRSGVIIAKRFQVVRKLKGSSDLEVYLCTFTDPTFGQKEVALGNVSEKALQNRSLFAKLSKELRASFVVENGFVASSLDLIRNPSTLMLVSEYFQGSPLTDLFEHNQALAIHEALQILKQCCIGMDAIHQTGCIHGAINPDNVVITDKGTVKLINLGFWPLFAHIISENKNKNDLKALDFYPPEFLEGNPLDKQADIYALGVLAFGLITGRLPFNGATVESRIAEKLEKNPPSPHHITSDCPDKLSAIVTRALARHRRIRYQSIAELFSDLLSIKLEDNKKGLNDELPAQGFRKRALLAEKIIFPIDLALPGNGLTDNLIFKLQELPPKVRIGGAGILTLAFLLLLWVGFWPTTQNAPMEAITTLVEDFAQTSPSPKPELSDYPGAFTIGDIRSLNGKIIFATQIKNKRKIAVLNLSEGSVRKLVDNEFDNYDQAVSADGQKLAFVSEKTGSPQIFVRGLEGGAETQVTNLQGAIKELTWSPDGKLIAFGAPQPSEQRADQVPIEIWSVGESGGEPTQITKLRGENLSPKWSPDGKSIAFVTNRYWPGNDICVWDLENSKENCVFTGKANYSRPNWVPNALVSRLIAVENSESGSQLVIQDLKTIKTSRISVLQDKITDPAYSPDGTSFIFISYNSSIKLYSIKMIVEGGDEQELLSSPYSIRNPIWIR